MKQDYFILDLAHSLHGRLRRVHVPYKYLYGVFGLLGFTCLILFGVAGSYARMAVKVSNYNTLQHQADMLRSRYENLQKTVRQTNEQLATLQMLASEVSTAYGVKNRLAGTPDLTSEAPLLPTMSETLAEYNFLRSTSFTSRGRNIFSRANANVVPGVWPINGRLMSGFGSRSDPFSGEGAVHPGIDISAPIGTPVKAAADGMIVLSGTNFGYGRCVIIDHGNGYQTLYGHLSRLDVIQGQEIRQGETLGAVGMSGRSTGPHLHYEVRLHSTAINPYRFLARASTVATTHTASSEFPF